MRWKPTKPAPTDAGPAFVLELALYQLVGALMGFIEQHEGTSCVSNFIRPATHPVTGCSPKPCASVRRHLSNNVAVVQTPPFVARAARRGLLRVRLDPGLRFS